jgi:hypothetical protein
MSWFSDLFKKKSVPELPKYEGPRSQTELTGGKELLNQLLARQGSSGRLRDTYYNDIFEPTATKVRQEWSDYLEPQMSADASARGLGRSTLTSDLMRRSAGEREMGLATLGGELKSRGFEQGLQQEDFGTSGLQNYVGAEGNLASNAAGIDYNRGVQQYGLNANAAEYNKNRLSNALMTAGNIATTLGSFDLTNSLMQRSGDRRGAVTGNPYNNYAGTGGSYYPGGYKKMSGLIR